MPCNILIRADIANRMCRNVIVCRRKTRCLHALKGYAGKLPFPLRCDIKQRIPDGVPFNYYDTICRQVANRLPNIQKFASEHDWVYFVAGKKSSNGKMLFEECRKANPNSQFISDAEEITERLPKQVSKVGVCGATSTPKWLMEKIAERIKQLNEE